MDANRAQIQPCLKNLEEAQTVRETKAQIIVAENLAIGENTRLIAGTDNARPTFNLTITHNQAAEGAYMAAGVHSADILKALLQQNAASATMMSIVQTGTFNPNSSAVKDLIHRQTEARWSEAAPRRIEEAYNSLDTVVPMEQKQTNTVAGHEL